MITILVSVTGDSHRKGGTICKSPGSFQVKLEQKYQVQTMVSSLKLKMVTSISQHQVGVSSLTLEIF